jgi:hypothetical protein
MAGARRLAANRESDDAGADDQHLHFSGSI